MDAIIQVDHLVKKYGDVIAVNDISFKVKRGSLFAFLGPNGAGKSTTINIMTTLLEKNSGSVLLNGISDEKYFRNKIGVVFQSNILDEELTVKENLMYRGSLYINDKEALKTRYKELASYLQLQEFENKRYKVLSGGQKRRVEIARALFSNPELLLLDEPTTGLDPETRQIVWRVIDDLKKNKGITIFLTTHYMEEAANADHVVIINKGKIVAEGTPAYLKEEYSSDRIKIVPKDKIAFKQQLALLNRSYEHIADQFIMMVKDTVDTLNLIDILRDHIKQFEVVKGTMDDVFLKVIGGEQHV